MDKFTIDLLTKADQPSALIAPLSEAILAMPIVHDELTCAQQLRTLVASKNFL